MAKPSVTQWQQAHDIFESYLDKPIAESLQELEQNSSISSEVKQLVKRLLNSLTDEKTSLENADLSYFEALNDESTDLTDSTIQDYHLLEKIGEGGMAQVYKAERTQSTIQKYVAIKVLAKKHKLSQELEKLFESEQVTLSKLTHPNIISFHHGGLSADGLAYLVMEYIDKAEKISHYCQLNKLGTKAIIKLILPIIDALGYAHQQLIVHKDIKPGNILIDAHGKPYLVDFGIASITEQKTHTKLPYIYTPDYASPEQFLKQKITTASDIFSLVATLLDLLTGKKRNSIANQTQYQYAKDKQNIDKILTNSSLDKDLQNIIKKGLSEKPNDRYQSALDLKHDLLNWLDSKPVTATPRTGFYVFQKFVKRNPYSTALVSLLFIAILFSLSAMFVQMKHAELEAQKAKQVSNLLIESIQASDPDLTKGQDLSVKELLNNAMLKIQESALQDPLLTSSLQQNIGTALAKTGQYKQAQKLLLQSIASDSKNSDARLMLAQLYLTQKQQKDATEQYQYLLSQRSTLNPEQLLQLQQIKAKLLLLKGDFDAAISTIKSLIDKKDTATKQAIENRLILADILDKKGNSSQAVEVLENTLALSQEKLGALSTTSTNISKRLADTLSNTNPVPYDKLFKIYQQTIQAQIELYGDKHPLVAKTYLQYGFALNSNGKIQESKKAANTAYNIATNQFGEDHILTAHINLLLSQIELKQDINQAITTLKKVIPVYEKSYGKNHFETNQVKTTLALYLLKTKQAGQATAILLSLYDSQKHQLGENHQATLYVVLNLIKAYDLAGNYNKAIELGEDGLSRSQQHLGKEFIITVGIQMALAKTYLNNKQATQAINILKPLLSMKIITGNPAYHKRVALLLAQGYFENKQFNQANQIIEQILTQYYTNDETLDENYNQLLSFRTK